MTLEGQLISLLRAWDKAGRAPDGITYDIAEELRLRLELKRQIRTIPSGVEQTFLYLAAPYHHAQLRVESYRARAAAQAAAMLIAEGIWTLAPTAHGHALVEQNPELRGPEWAGLWLTYGLRLVSLSHCLAVLRLHGWEESEGVRGEIETAQNLGIPVLYLDPRSGFEAFLAEYKAAGF